jgi:xylulokinase
MPLVLGVDSSTQATKVEVRDADDGQLVARGRAPHARTTPPRSEQDPRTWWDALVAAVAEADIHDVAAVSVAGQQHGMVVLDAAGAVLRPAKLWNDTESAAEADAMVRSLGAEVWAKRCGSVPVASFTITKLAWLARHEPDVFARIGTVLLPHDYLTYRLTGRRVTDRGDASGTGYWSPVEQWLEDLLDEFAGKCPRGRWRDCLPSVLGPNEPAGHVRGVDGLDALELRSAAICAPGTGDNMAAALGVGLRPGDIAVSLGSSGTVYSVSESPTADPTGAVAGFADATGRFLPLVCTLNATQVTDAFARLLGVDLDALDEMARRAPAGAGGVVLVPYLDGERTPNRPDATGTLSGLRTDTTREQLARAAFEGVLCGLLDGLDALTAVGVGAHGGSTGGRVLLVGGGGRSPAYQQIAADLLGAEVTVPDAAEHVAAGACVQAAAVLHGLPPEDVAASWQLGSGRTIEPSGRVDPDAVRAAYAATRDGSG